MYSNSFRLKNIFYWLNECKLKRILASVYAEFIYPLYVHNGIDYVLLEKNLAVSFKKRKKKKNRYEKTAEIIITPRVYI